MKARTRHVEPELGAYVLGALDEQESARVEAHLRDCASCRRARTDYQSVADGLLHSLRSVRPPASLRSRLRQRIRPGAPASVYTRPGGRPNAYAVLSVALALAVVALGVFTWQTQNSLRLIESRFESAQAASSQQAQVDSVSLALLTYPGRQVALVTGDQAYGTVLFEPHLPMAVLNAWGLPDLDKSHIFQAWLVRPDGERVSAGVFVRDEGSPFTRVLLEMPEPASQYVGLGVTVEPQGGTSTPTGTRILQADF